jgi:serine/threonine protein kinase
VLYGKEIAAVKRLSSFDTEALKRELNNLSGLNHQNIVQLLGYCYETTRALHEEEQEFVSEICIAMIFEYMHKGSLETYLQGKMMNLFILYYLMYTMLISIAFSPSPLIYVVLQQMNQKHGTGRQTTKLLRGLARV